MQLNEQQQAILRGNFTNMTVENEPMQGRTHSTITFLHRVSPYEWQARDENGNTVYVSNDDAQRYAFIALQQAFDISRHQERILVAE